MVYQDLTNISSNDIVGILSFPNLDSGLIFFPMLMSVVFLLFTFGTYFSEKQRVGKGNFLSSLAVSSFISIVLAVLLNFLTLIDTGIMVKALVIYGIFIVLYLVTNKN